MRKKEEAIRKGIFVKTKLPVEFDKLSEKSLCSWDIPEFYLDELYKCIDCGKQFIHTAETQKEWYEVQKKYIWQRPNRCDTHFQEWRVARKSKFEMDKALEKLREFPEDRKLLKSYAESIVKFHKNHERGNLQIAMSIFNKLEIKSNHSAYCRDRLKGIDIE